MTLSIVEKERYSRHLIMDGFGEPAQLKLQQANVLVIGAGGLGCPVIQYLVAAGVGTLGIVDADVVSLSNLQRQILYTETEIGQSKAEISATKMRALNSNCSIEVYNAFLTVQLAEELFPHYDVVVGCTDNFQSRYIIDQYSKLCQIPFVHGSIREFEGQLCVFNYNGSCSYSDVFGDAPSAESATPTGVVGAIPGIVGSLMAIETLKIITQCGIVHANKLLLIDLFNNSFRQLPF